MNRSPKLRFATNVLLMLIPPGLSDWWSACAWQDTIVRDPFFHRIPAFFNMSMKDIFAAKHPTTWMEFEKGLIDETELYKRFFTDCRPIDGPAMLADMVSQIPHNNKFNEVMILPSSQRCASCTTVGQLGSLYWSEVLSVQSTTLISQ